MIKIDGVSKHVLKRTGWLKTTKLTLLKDINIQIQKNQFVVILGRNGSGKSTLLKCISGMIFPEEGSIKVMGIDSFKNRTKLSKNMGIMFGQKSLLFTDLRAIDYLNLLKKIYSISEDSFLEMIDLVDMFLPCKDLLDKQVRGMSYGEKMKIELLSILLHKPQLLILDEPFVGLDPSSQKNLLEFIQHYKIVYKATILLTTHQSLEVLNLADRAIILDAGKKTYDGEVNRLLESYSNKKIVKVHWATSSDSYLTDIFDGINVIKQTPDYLELSVEIKKCSVEMLITFLMGQSEIADFEIESISIDKVVESLYEDGALLSPVVS